MISTPTLLFKAQDIGNDGHFSGYAAVFGNIDQGGDVIEPGAFKELVKTRDGKTLILYQHDARDPIGKADVRQDAKGLAFTGTLELADPTAKKAYTLMKRGLIEHMSIGYDVLPGGAQIRQDGVRVLKALKLYEISAVTWGMNPLAHVDAVKMRDCTDPRELKNYLRDQHQFSRTKAAAAAEALWKILRGADNTTDSERLSDALELFNNSLKGM